MHKYSIWRWNYNFIPCLLRPWVMINFCYSLLLANLSWQTMLLAQNKVHNIQILNYVFHDQSTDYSRHVKHICFGWVGIILCIFHTINHWGWQDGIKGFPGLSPTRVGPVKFRMTNSIFGWTFSPVLSTLNFNFIHSSYINIWPPLKW